MKRIKVAFSLFSAAMFLSNSGIEARTNFRLDRPPEESIQSQDEMPPVAPMVAPPRSTRLAPPSYAPNSPQTTFRSTVPSVTVQMNDGVGRFQQALDVAAPILDVFNRDPSRTAVGLNEPFNPGGGLTVAQIRKLENKDVVIIIDKSNSMTTQDCRTGLNGFGLFSPNNDVISRWEWCRRECMSLSGKLARIQGARLSIVLFDTQASLYRNVSPMMVPAIFSRQEPGGGTDLAKALRCGLQEHFAKFDHSRGTVIACITDGDSGQLRELKDIITGTTHQVRGAQEIGITFLQVGVDKRGSKVIPELDQKLVQDGALFDIVSARSFDQLRQTGLINALIDAVS
ncbi:MAG: hypothetical protein K2Z81_13385 [Cyanobacteria bacterium]|nr:hypothetical protein [Cyanobacteriota bacterium]